jgi:hypothetical protein
MPAIYAEVDEDLYERFKAKINERSSGMKKGDLAKAVIEALELWLKQKA